MEQDNRWEQRFANYIKALQKLTEAVNYVNNKVEENREDNADSFIDVLDEIVKEGLIQRFEYTHELAWNVMKDYARYQGNSSVGGSRDATREAFLLNLLPDGEVWMDMIGSRNRTSHTYNEEIADEIYFKILNEYYPALLDFQTMMNTKIGGKQRSF